MDPFKSLVFFHRVATPFPFDAFEGDEGIGGIKGGNFFKGGRDWRLTACSTGGFCWEEEISLIGDLARVGSASCFIEPRS